MFKQLFKDLKQLRAERRKLRRARVCVVSYPKSGRTWLRVLIGKALCEQFSLEERLVVENSELMRACGLDPIFYSHDGSSNSEARPADRLNHNKSKYRRKRVILLVRDPRDVVVSCYFQATRRRGIFSGEISDFIRDERFGIRKIIAFHRGWHAALKVPEAVLLLRYEQMRANPLDALKTTLKFIGAGDVGDEVCGRAVEFASFERMKEQERSGGFQRKSLRPGDAGDAESFKVRRGKIGGYVDYLNEADCEFVERVMNEDVCPFYSTPNSDV